jgi:hypothetical protein
LRTVDWPHEAAVAAAELERFFQEAKTIAENGFRFQEDVEAFTYVESLACEVGERQSKGT